MKYTGGRTDNEIIDWYLKKTKPSSTLVESCENLQILMEAQKLSVVFFGDLKSSEFHNVY